MTYICVVGLASITAIVGDVRGVYYLTTSLGRLSSALYVRPVTTATIVLSQVL